MLYGIHPCTQSGRRRFEHDLTWPSTAPLALIQALLLPLQHSTRGRTEHSLTLSLREWVSEWLSQLCVCTCGPLESDESVWTARFMPENWWRDLCRRFGLAQGHPWAWWWGRWWWWWWSPSDKATNAIGFLVAPKSPVVCRGSSRKEPWPRN